jgi:16S rRNA processing protein RimM
VASIKGCFFNGFTYREVIFLNTDRFTVGQIVNTHGLRGEVRIKNYTTYPDEFESFDYLIVEGEGDRKRKVDSVRYVKNLVLVKFEGVDHIDQAELLKNKEVYRLRSDYGHLKEGEYFIVDLIGLKVVDEKDGLVGQVKDVLKYSAQDLYLIERAGHPDFMIPAVDAFVREIDLEAGELRVTLIEGMME